MAHENNDNWNYDYRDNPFIDRSKMPPQILALYDSGDKSDRNVAEDYYRAVIMQPVINRRIIKMWGRKQNEMGMTKLQEDCNALRTENIKLQSVNNGLTTEVERLETANQNLRKTIMEMSRK